MALPRPRPSLHPGAAASIAAGFVLEGAAVAVLGGATLAEVRLPALLSSHMVLQRETDAPLWGWAAPGEAVRIQAGWSQDPVTCVAGADGRWIVSLPTPPAGGPYTITLAGTNTITLVDVLIGDVWVCSGQSNMEWPVGKTTWAPGVGYWEKELAQANWPRIRLFDVANTVAASPRDDCGGAWSACTAESVRGFSAVGYFFGREVHRESGVPIGLIGASWGGTRVEAWTSEEALRAFPDLAGDLEKLARVRKSPADPAREGRNAIQRWWSDLASRDPGSREKGWNAPDLDDSSWSGMMLPATWDGDLGDFDGVVWFRRAVEIPAAWAGRELRLDLGPIDDMDTTWFDGERVGGIETTGGWQTPRSYKVPASLATQGRHMIAVRVLDTGGQGGINGTSESMGLAPAGGPAPDGSAADKGARPIPLSGPWKCRSGAKLSDLPPWPTAGESFDQNGACSLFNGMIAPLVPFAIRGAIWYQGESNRATAQRYRALFTAMIADWRARWGRGDFPFYYVQIAPFRYAGDQGETARLREAQLLALSTPSTGMVVTMDIGDPANIHPANKQEVGRRLALWALAKAYGKADLECSGPLYRSMRVDGSAIRISFEHGKGLTSRGGAPCCLQIAGGDHWFVPANARIEGDELVVTSDSVRSPAAVRYAWDDDVEANFFNGAGLPASPFRTDDWPR